MFSPTSYWNQRLPANTPVDTNSAAIIAQIVAQREASGTFFTIGDHSVSFFIAGPSTPTQKVTVDHANQTGEIAEGLKKMFAAVPIPPEARPVGPWSSFGDNHMVIYQPSTDTLWEGWQWSQFEVDGPHTTEGVSAEILEAPGWHVVEGAGIKEASKNPGYFIEGSWPEVTAAHKYAARASGLLLPGGAIFPAEAQRLYIPHAIAVSAKTLYNTPRFPAPRTDGKSTDPTMPAEGMLVRLPANHACTNANSFGKAVEVAWRDFGAIFCDTAGDLTVKLVDEATKRGAHGYNTDVWSSIIAQNKVLGESLPWSSLEVVAESYRPSTNVPGVML